MTRAGYNKPLPPTLFDYLLLGVNPTLVGVMVGSLGFFLIAAFYQGDFSARLSFIMAMYVMGIVGTSRIGIEQGREYALLFAIPLGIVSMMAMVQFVSASMLFSILFLGLLWFCAHKLTWDCTVVEESEDSSGRGLLETAGLQGGSDGTSATPTSPSAQPHRDLEGTTRSIDEAMRDPPTRWWQRLAQRARRPRAHGVWVIYFALAALPIFGFGQRFTESIDARRYMLQLFCIYLGSGLALLMTTSLVGLRMYLRRRRFVMEDDMTGVWVASGAAMIAIILLACLLIPRPAPEYSITQIWKVTSPVDVPVSDSGLFGGQPDNREPAKSSSSTIKDNPGRQPDPRSSQSNTGKSESSTGKTQSSSGTSSSQPKTSASDPSQANTSQPNAGQNNPGDASSRQSAQGSADRRSGNQAGQQSSAANQRSANQNETKNSDSASTKSDPSNAQQERRSNGTSRQSPSQRSFEQAAKEHERSTNRSSGRRASSGGASSSSSGPASSSSADRASSASSSNQRSSASESTASSSAREYTPPQVNPGGLFGGLAQLLTWIYYLAFALLCIYLLWRFREQISRGLADLMNQLRELWASLFGGRQRERTIARERLAIDEPAKAEPFSSFANPFAAGTAEQVSVGELVTYTFRALEAWAREQGTARPAEQTPLEFAQMLVSKSPAVGQPAQDLCDFYCRLAYGNGQLPRQARERVQLLWREMESQQRA